MGRKRKGTFHSVRTEDLDRLLRELNRAQTRPGDFYDAARTLIGWAEPIQDSPNTPADPDEHPHGPRDWFTAGKFPSCSCGFDPRDNEALTTHWREHGVRWIDNGGTLASEPVPNDVERMFDMPSPEADALDRIAGIVTDDDLWGTDERYEAILAILRETGRL